MNKTGNIKRPLLTFFLLTYAIFWLLILLTGTLKLLNVPKTILNTLIVICSWSPSFAFLFLFRKLYPNITLKDFLKQQFCSRIKISVLIVLLLVHIFILIAARATYSFINETPVFFILSASFGAIVTGFFSHLIKGPLGEELGWRSYALNDLQKRFSPLISAILLGLVWGFWHAPLWFLTSGYSGMDLFRYIALFMVCIISTSIVITAFYNINKNLVIPIVIHLLFNLVFTLVGLDALQALQYISPWYLLFVLVLLIANPKKALYGAATPGRRNNPSFRF
jgi:membrane protease YdiL (CAAX protease family)